MPSGLPTPVAPSFDHVGALAPGAFAIAIMCFLETASVARSVRRRDEPPIDNDQELAANGIACVAGAFFRAMPSAGGFSQTAINQRAGAVTQLSELVTAALAVGCALFLGGVLSDLPEATLGCMVVVAVLGLIKPAEMVRLWRLGRIEFWVAAITAVSGLCFGLLVAVAVGVALTLFLVIYELDHVGVTELQATSPTATATCSSPARTRRPIDGLLILRFDGPLYTANVRGANRKILAAVDARTPDDRGPRRLGRSVLPVTVLEQFADLQREFDRRGVTLWVAALPPRSLETARAVAGVGGGELPRVACSRRRWPPPRLRWQHLRGRTAQMATDEELLASWNDTPTRQAIVDFVDTVTDRGRRRVRPPGGAHRHVRQRRHAVGGEADPDPARLHAATARRDGRGRPAAARPAAVQGVLRARHRLARPGDGQALPRRRQRPRPADGGGRRRRSPT